MKKIITVCVLLVGLLLSNSVLSNEPNYGPDDCLLDTTPNCPISFMEHAMCHSNPSVCLRWPMSNQYTLSDRLFALYYSNAFFGSGSGLFLLMPLKESYTNEVLHEMFEFGICYVSPDSCYQEGENGLTLYHEIETVDCVPRAPGGCHGGPSDSAICQVTPEACNGIFGPD